jgi:hypothetical protein
MFQAYTWHFSRALYNFYFFEVNFEENERNFMNFFLIKSWLQTLYIFIYFIFYNVNKEYWFNKKDFNKMARLFNLRKTLGVVNLSHEFNSPSAINVIEMNERKRLLPISKISFWNLPFRKNLLEPKHCTSCSRRSFHHHVKNVRLSVDKVGKNSCVGKKATKTLNKRYKYWMTQTMKKYFWSFLIVMIWCTRRFGILTLT